MRERREEKRMRGRNKGWWGGGEKKGRWERRRVEGREEGRD